MRALRFRSPLFFIPIVLLSWTCGGESPTDPGMEDGPMSATIDGQPWAASASSVSAQALGSIPGAFVLTGTQIKSSTDVSVMSFSLYNISGPGTYDLGVTSTMFGGTVLFVEGGAGWLTELSGLAGTVTITALTPTRIAGTFNFEAIASTGGASGTRTVTSGEFDLPLQSGGSLLPVPESAGSRVSASLNGTAWNGASIALGYANESLAFSTGNTDFFVTLVASAIAAPGVYPLNNGIPMRSVRVTNGTDAATETNCCWDSGQAGASGSVTITSITADRIVGSFSVMLPPDPGSAASSNMVIANGLFDLGLGG